MTPCNELLARPEPAQHLVQFYGEEPVLVRNVSRYLQEGAGRGDWMVVIATSAHAEAFRKQLRDSRVDTDDLLGTGRLQMLDAEATLSRFMVGSEPDWVRFDAAVGSLVRDTVARAGRSAVRAYGEMVDILWKAGNLHGATRLEEFWNLLLERYRFALYCAYTVDLMDSKVRGEALQGMLNTHSHLLPVRRNGELDRAVQKAMNEVLGAAKVQALMPLIRATQRPHAVIHAAEATVLWLHGNLKPYVREILSRARAYYEQECAGQDPEREA